MGDRNNTSTQLLDGNYMNPELLEHLTASGIKGPGLFGMPGYGVFTSKATVSASFFFLGTLILIIIIIYIFYNKYK